jgi:hypothetical protein
MGADGPTNRRIKSLIEALKGGEGGVRGGVEKKEE